MNRRLLLASAALAVSATGLLGCSAEPAGNATTASSTAESNTTPVSLSYSVAGLHCDGCVAGVTETVNGIPGVSECEVSLEEGRMVVLVDSQATGDAVAEAVRGMSYTVAPLPGDDATADG